MIRPLSLSFLALSCAVPEQVLDLGDDDPPLEEAALASGADTPAPPPGALALEVDNVVASSFSALHVSGATPGAPLVVVYSRQGLGSGWCPGALGGECLALLDPVVRVPVALVADGDGEADALLITPRAWGGGYLAVQVAEMGGVAVLSNAVGRPIAAHGTSISAGVDGDGDGYTPAAGDCGDARSDFHPLADDPPGDGLDSNCDGEDGCVLPCGSSICGNTVVEGDEDCDDGNLVSTDLCIACAAAVCGDGSVLAGVEQCDDGNSSVTDACAACQHATCGDGFLRAGLEQCDDGNTSNTDACAACHDATCGDGFLQSGVEACDDGNAVTTDACVDCVPASCGDGVVRAGVEQCDDGNNLPGDGCEADCTLPTPVDCLAIKTANPAAASATYTIDPDGPGGVAAFPVWCDMTHEGGGWTLVLVRSRNVATAHRTSVLLPTDLGQAITNERWAALQVISEESYGTGSTYSDGFVASLAPMRTASCSPLATDLTFRVIAHDENSGCNAVGTDYSLWFGTLSVADNSENTLCYNRSSHPFFAPPQASGYRPNPGLMFVR